MRDKIEEIRARHAQSDNNFIEYESTGDIHADRATLLAEVDRQRADLALEKSRKVLQRAEIERMRAEIDGLEAELALMKSGFEVAYRMLGDKP